jgi:hypothetical protein
VRILKDFQALCFDNDVQVQNTKGLSGEIPQVHILVRLGGKPFQNFGDKVRAGLGKFAGL